MKVREFMSREVVTLRPEDPIQEGARLLTKNCTSALPVVNGNSAIVGMLTEGDLLIRLKNRRLSWWRTMFADGAALAREYQKAVGTKVEDVMRPAPVPVDPETSLESAAERLEQAGTGVLPVLADGRLVGMVSGKDLVKAVAETLDQTDLSCANAELVAQMKDQLSRLTGMVSYGDVAKAVAETECQAEGSRTDDELFVEMKARLAREPWVSNRAIWIAAKNGVLTLFGLIDAEEEKTALGVMARTIAGCKGVENNLFPKSLLCGRRWA